MANPNDEQASDAGSRVGTVLRGKYRIDAVLGIGSMGAVYKVTHRNQAEFALKVLHADVSSRELRHRFLREGYAANSVKHPGAVLVVDDDVTEDGAPFLVMELLHGESVDSLWKRASRRLTPRAALAIGHQILDVLAAAHAKGIVHRDIKPANLFVTRDGVAKVLDFGIARAKQADVAAACDTGTGVMLGTPAFMAPEQAIAKARAIDGQTDLWAVGATLFTLMSGEYVHEGETGPELLINAASVPARSLARVMPGMPPPVIEVVDRALAFEKSARWPSAVAMREALGAAYAGMFGELVSRTPLLALLSDSVSGVAATARLGAPSSIIDATPPPPTKGGTLREQESSPRLDASPAGCTPAGTPPPVSAGRAGTGWPASRAHRLPFGVAAVAVAIALGVGAVAFRRARPAVVASASSTRSASNQSSPSAQPGEPPPSIATDPSSAPGEVARSVDPPNDRPSPSQVTRGTDGGPYAPRFLGAAAPRPTADRMPLWHANPVASGPPMTAPATPSEATSVRSTPSPRCAILTNYDRKGQPHFVSVCK
jgi:serine/threonine-protein kinase